MSRPIRIAALLGLAVLTAEPAAAKNTITVTLTQILGTTDAAKVKDYTEYLGAVNTYEGRTTVDGKGDSLPALQKRLVADQTDVFVLTATERHAIHRCLTGYQWSPIQNFGYNFSKFSWTCQ